MKMKRSHYADMFGPTTGDKVRLGIDAPSDIPVHRQEVYEAIQRENRKATQLKPDDTRDLGNTNPSGR